MADEATSIRRKLGKYEIRREVGRGGMGVVYEGYDPVIHRRVALKTLVSELFTGTEAETYLTRLQREAQAAGRLNHPNIVAVYDFGEEPPADPAKSKLGTAFIAMEFVEGRELRDFLKEGERFPLPTVVRIMSQLLDALDYSHHNGIVHRDIKPANLIVLPDGSLKVTDFGIARIESSTLTQAGTVMGSPSYMAPEQFLGQTVDGRCDLYSAAVVLYEMLTGEVPFAGSFSNIMHRVLNEQATPPSVLNVNLPTSADGLLTRALAKRPADRFQTAAEFKQALLAGFAGEAAATPPRNPTIPDRDATQLSQPPSVAAPAAARRRMGMVVAACALVIAAGAALWLWRPHSSTPAAPGTAVGAGPSARHSADNSGSNGSADSAASTESAGGGKFAGSRDAAGSGDSARSGDSAGGVAGRESAATGRDAGPMPPGPAVKGGTAVITAVGLADPQDPRFAQQPTPIERRVWGDARRQLIEKAVALYIDPQSINGNYALLRDKLFSRSDQYISTVLEETPPTLSRYGLMLATVRATVKVHEVQKSLNTISREDRVEFIRNNGNPSIAVDIRVQGSATDLSGTLQRSAVAENILMERIRSFGFVAVEGPGTTPPPDFQVKGEVAFKHLTATLPASGLTIEKVVLTSWTIRALDTRSGEEVYINTKIPQKQSWASEELALQDVGRLMGAEFSRDFFLQYFDFGAQRVRVHLTGLPAGATGAVLAEANAALRILNATLSRSQAGTETTLDLDLSGGSDTAADLVQGALLDPLNRKLGNRCFGAPQGGSGELRITYDAACATDAMLARLDRLPPEALLDAPRSRIEDIVSDPARINGGTTL